MASVEQERRKSGLTPERIIANTLTAAALAFGIYSYVTTFLDGIQSDIDGLALEQAVLSGRLDAYYREREPWIKRVELLESRCNEVRERLGDSR